MPGRRGRGAARSSSTPSLSRDSPAAATPIAVSTATTAAATPVRASPAPSSASRAASEYLYTTSRLPNGRKQYHCTRPGCRRVFITLSGLKYHQSRTCNPAKDEAEAEARRLRDEKRAQATMLRAERQQQAAEAWMRDTQQRTGAPPSATALIEAAAAGTAVGRAAWPTTGLRDAYAGAFVPRYLDPALPHETEQEVDGVPEVAVACVDDACRGIFFPNWVVWVLHMCEKHATLAAAMGLHVPH